MKSQSGKDPIGELVQCLALLEIGGRIALHDLLQQYRIQICKF
jgi:hypothetical protein